MQDLKLSRQINVQKSSRAISRSSAGDHDDGDGGDLWNAGF
jgi:hypothetical protein